MHQTCPCWVHSICTAQLYATCRVHGAPMSSLLASSLTHQHAIVVSVLLPLLCSSNPGQVLGLFTFDARFWWLQIPFEELGSAKASKRAPSVPLPSSRPVLHPTARRAASFGRQPGMIALHVQGAAHHLSLVRAVDDGQPLLKESQVKMCFSSKLHICDWADASCGMLACAYQRVAVSRAVSSLICNLGCPSDLPGMLNL